MMVKELSAASPAGLSPLARALVDSLGQGVVVFDAQGKLVYANASARQTLTPERTGASPPPAADGLLRSELAALGARRIALKVGGVGVGEAIFFNDPRTLAEQERQAILDKLRGTNGKLTETARQLGISRTTLWRRLKAYGLDRGQGPGERGEPGWRQSS